MSNNISLEKQLDDDLKPTKKSSGSINSEEISLNNQTSNYVPSKQIDQNFLPLHYYIKGEINTVKNDLKDGDIKRLDQKIDKVESNTKWVGGIIVASGGLFYFKDDLLPLITLIERFIK